MALPRHDSTLLPTGTLLIPPSTVPCHGPPFLSGRGGGGEWHKSWNGVNRTEGDDIIDDDDDDALS